MLLDRAGVLGGHDDGVAGGDGSDLTQRRRRTSHWSGPIGIGKKLASYGDRSRRRIEEIGRLDTRLMVHIDRFLREQFERATAILEGHLRA